MRFVHQGNLKNPDKRDIAFDSDIGGLKIMLGRDPAHIGKFSYKIPTGLANGAHLVGEVKHGYDYVPSGIVQIVDKRFAEPRYSVLTFQLIGFGFPAVDTYTFFYRIDSDALRIYFQVTNNADALENTNWDLEYEIYAEPGSAS